MTEQPDALETVLAAARDADAEAAATMREVRAEGLTFADAVRIREAAAVLDIAMPRILAEQRDAGRSVKDMARALDVTESYVHRLIRQHRAAEDAPPVGEYQLSSRGKWSAFWTVERREAGEWQEQTTQSTTTTDAPDDLARALLDQMQEHEGAAQWRIRVWRFGESDTHPPLATAETDQ